MANLLKNPPAIRETWVGPWVGKIAWRRERLPTPVFWPREFHGLYSTWGCKESDKTELLSLTYLLSDFSLLFGLPWWLRGYSVCLECRRPGFNPRVGKIPWRRQWHPTPVLLPGESHGGRSLVGYSPWGCRVQQD